MLGRAEQLKVLLAHLQVRTTYCYCKATQMKHRRVSDLTLGWLLHFEGQCCNVTPVDILSQPHDSILLRVTKMCCWTLLLMTCRGSQGAAGTLAGKKVLHYSLYRAP